MKARVPVYMLRSDSRDGHVSEELVGSAEITDDEVFIRITNKQILDVCGNMIPMDALRGFQIGVSYLPAKEKK